jgi:GNAT superfamily N-acetyltransferase
VTEVDGHRTTTVAVRAVAWDDPVAVALRAAMTAEIERRYADRMAELRAQPDVFAVVADTVAYTAIAVTDAGQPVGHLGLRWVGADLELKRMYVAPEQRGSGVSGALLAAAEQAARALGVRRIILQTGDRQPEAVRLYQKAGYSPIPIFPPYQGVAFSLCFAKTIDA